MNSVLGIKTLKIDDQDVGATEHQTILEVARENNIFIPSLCYVKSLTKAAACRLCLVEVKGSSRLVAACVTKVEEGMEVITNSERVKKTRKSILALLFSERNHTCAVCVSNNHCDLQQLSQLLEMDHVYYPYLYPKLPVDASHKRFVADHNRCILCSACIRVCSEIEGAHNWDFAGRGVKTKVVTDLNSPWGDGTRCTECGKCVQICPTGALFEKGRSVAEMAKKRPNLAYLRSIRRDSNE